MTTEEMFQLLLNKVDTNHTEVKAEIARLEAKLDGAITDIKELKTDVSEIKEDVHLLKKLDDIDSSSINAAFVDIKEIKEKINNLDKQSNIVRILDKSVPSLQVRVSDLEDEVVQIKKQLVKAS